MRRLGISLASAHGLMAVAAAHTRFTPMAIDREWGAGEARTRRRITRRRVGTPRPGASGISGGWSAAGSSNAIARARRREQPQARVRRDGGSVSTVTSRPWVGRFGGGRRACKPLLAVTEGGASARPAGQHLARATATPFPAAHPLRDALRANLAGGTAVRSSATSRGQSPTAVESRLRDWATADQTGAALPGNRGWFASGPRSATSRLQLTADRTRLRLRHLAAPPVN